MFTREWFLKKEEIIRSEVGEVDRSKINLINQQVLSLCAFKIAEANEIIHIHAAYKKVAQACPEAWLYRKNFRIQLQGKIVAALKSTFSDMLSIFFQRVLQVYRTGQKDVWKGFLLSGELFTANTADGKEDEAASKEIVSPQIIRTILGDIFALLGKEEDGDESCVRKELITEVLSQLGRQPAPLPDSQIVQELIASVFSKMPSLDAIAIVLAEEISFLGEVQSTTFEAVTQSSVNDGRIYEPTEEHTYYQDCAWMLAHFHSGHDFVLRDKVTPKNMVRNTGGHENELSGFAREVALVMKFVNMGYYEIKIQRDKMFLHCKEQPRKLFQFTLFDMLMKDKDVIDLYRSLGEKLQLEKYDWDTTIREIRPVIAPSLRISTTEEKSDSEDTEDAKKTIKLSTVKHLPSSSSSMSSSQSSSSSTKSSSSSCSLSLSSSSSFFVQPQSAPSSSSSSSASSAASTASSLSSYSAFPSPSSSSSASR